ncbi:MAG: zf-HC2 domain-containing protein [Caulobacter sp.]|nr:zf-HC2 domain-containing protein [Caulobacter sp.]
MTVTDEMLMAYVDGELSPEDRAMVDAAAAADEVLTARLARHLLLAGGLRGAFADIADEPVPGRLTALLGGGKVDSLDAARARRKTPTWGQWGMIAAGLVAGVMVGVSVPRGGQPMVGADMRAHGQLASALDSQLAAAPEKGALVKVGLSFRTQDHRYCRTFTVTKGEGPAGLACRDSDGWAVRMAVPVEATPRGDYRTAGSEIPPEILEAAQAIMIGEPLDQTGEATAKAHGWRHGY